MKPITFYNETWRTHYCVFLGWPWEKFHNYCLKKYNIDFGLYDNADGISTFVNPHGGFMWVKNKKDLAAIAHEALHLANYTLENAGVTPCFKNDEAQSYLMTYIINKVLKK